MEIQIRYMEKTDVDAVIQIEEKAYAAPYAADGRTLFKIGLNFSTKAKQIDEWQVDGY